MIRVTSPVTVRYFKHVDGKSSYLSWLHGLKDSVGRTRLMVRVDRLGRANLGDCKAIGNGIHELRVDQGPGYRIYFGFLNPHEVVILCGGDKSTQNQDIEKAKQYFALVKGRL